MVVVGDVELHPTLRQTVDLLRVAAISTTHQFYEKYAGKTINFFRLVPTFRAVCRGKNTTAAFRRNVIGVVMAPDFYLRVISFGMLLHSEQRTDDMLALFAQHCQVLELDATNAAARAAKCAPGG